jgi:hypothetical protein
MSGVVSVIVAGNSLHRFPKKKSKDGLKEVRYTLYYTYTYTYTQYIHYIHISLSLSLSLSALLNGVGGGG